QRRRNAETFHLPRPPQLAARRDGDVIARGDLEPVLRISIHYRSLWKARRGGLSIRRHSRFWSYGNMSQHRRGLASPATTAPNHREKPGAHGSRIDAPVVARDSRCSWALRASCRGYFWLTGIFTLPLAITSKVSDASARRSARFAA